MMKLKPCPFCGGEAKIYAYESEQVLYDKDTLGYLDTEYILKYGSYCEGCGCMNAEKMSEKSAAEAWNRRADN